MKEGPTMGLMSDDILSAPEAAERLGITTREVYDLIERGELAAYRTPTGAGIPAEAVARHPSK